MTGNPVVADDANHYQTLFDGGDAKFRVSDNEMKFSVTFAASSTWPTSIAQSKYSSGSKMPRAGSLVSTMRAGSARK
jgi:hypothetical protein